MNALTDFGKALLVTWCFVASVVLLAVLVLGCATAPSSAREVAVRRVDSLASMDALCDELGRDGWRVVAMSPYAGAWVVVLERGPR